MKSTLSSKSKKTNPSYVIISMALVQSEIYWICSVLYYVFHQSGLGTQQSLVNGTTKNISRLRCQSASALPLSLVLTSDDDDVQLGQEETELTLRRSSLPTPSTVDNNIRQRPSVYDEQKGTTCPPIWWQKTRVKLGRAPVHGDAKVITEAPKQIESPVNATPPPPPSTTIHFEEPIAPPTTIIAKNHSTTIPVPTAVNRPSSLSPISGTVFYDLYSTTKYTMSKEDIHLSRLASESSGLPNISEKDQQQQQQGVKKFMSKLNTVLKSIPHHHHHHRRDGS